MTVFHLEQFQTEHLLLNWPSLCCDLRRAELRMSCRPVSPLLPQAAPAVVAAGCALHPLPRGDREGELRTAESAMCNPAPIPAELLGVLINSRL